MCIRDSAQHAGVRTRVVGERRVGEGVIGLLGEPATLQVQQQGFVPGRLAGGENMLDARPDIRPDFLPNLVRPAADHPVALQADGRQVSVVTEEGQIRTPGHPHGETRRQHDANDRAEAGGPGVRRPEGRQPPLAGAHKRPNLPWAAKQGRFFVNRRIGLD